MRIAVIGASGWLGGAIAREALERGHEVTGIARDPSKIDIEGVTPVIADARDPDAVAEAIAGHDAVVVAVTDRSTSDRGVIPAAARTLLRALPDARVGRLLWIGGGGTLESEPGVRFVDSPSFPEQYEAEALAQGQALETLRAARDLDWSYLSPPAHELAPGEKTGRYRAEAGDTPVFDAEGRNHITSGDLAAAAVDELEQERFTGQRFTAGAV